MKKILIITALLFICSIFSFAQTKVEKAIASVVERLRTAMVDANKGELEKVTLDKLSYGHSGGTVEGKAAFIEKITSGRSDFVSINLSAQTISVSGKTAIVRHHLDAVTNDAGKVGEVHLLVLLVLQKQGGTWKLLARQAVKITP